MSDWMSEGWNGFLMSAAQEFGGRIEGIFNAIGNLGSGTAIAATELAVGGGASLVSNAISSFGSSMEASSVQPITNLGEALGSVQGLLSMAQGGVYVADGTSVTPLPFGAAQVNGPARNDAGGGTQRILANV